MRKKLIVMMMVLSGSLLIGADFDWMATLNLRSNIDPQTYQSRLVSRFNTPQTQLSVIMKSVGAPADAYMILRLSEMSHKSPNFVLKEYQRSHGQGWGVMAKNLGIKPGSNDFKALKNGHDLRDFDDKDIKHQDNDKKPEKEHGKKSH